LKPEGINVKTAIDPVTWFLNGKDDIRSSYYLEDVATEFAIQGLERNIKGRPFWSRVLSVQLNPSRKDTLYD
jgi:hypothetical protein